MGNRRFIVASVVGAVVALTLTGCNAADATLGSTNGEAVAIGQQALGFTSSGSTSTGWTSPISCPGGFEEGLEAGLPATDTLQKLDPSTVSGPLADPQLTNGYLATCTYRLNTPTGSILELAFFDIDDTHAAALSTRLDADGFVSQGAVQSTSAQGQPYVQTIFLMGTSRVVLATTTINSVPALIVAG